MTPLPPSPPSPPTPPTPPTPAAPAAELPPRLRRAIEVVYAVEGVVAVRIWQWPGTVALGVVTAPPGSEDVLRRVDLVTSPLRDPGETWELGLLESDPTQRT